MDAPFSGPHPDIERTSAKAGTRQASLPGEFAIMRINSRCDNTTPKRGRYYADDKLSHGDIAHFIVLLLAVPQALSKEKNEL